MNLDELVHSISNDDSDERIKLVHWVEDWKNSDKTVIDLLSLIEKWHGNVWFSNQEDQNKFYDNWVKFKQEAIDNIGGMTMNERLYWFGLFDIFDSCEDDVAKLIIYKKLLANP